MLRISRNTQSFIGRDRPLRGALLASNGALASFSIILRSRRDWRLCQRAFGLQHRDRDLLEEQAQRHGR